MSRKGRPNRASTPTQNNQLGLLKTALQQAINLHHQGSLPQAEHLYRQVLSIDPNNYAANHNLGIISEQAGRSDLALPLLKKAVKTNPKDPTVHLNIGATYSSLGNTKKALTYYRKAVSLAPKLAIAHYNAGVELHKQGDNAAAIQCYQKSISLDPTYPNALANISTLQTQAGDISKAITNGEKSIALQPDHIESHYNLSVALLLDGQLERGWKHQEWRIKQSDGRVRQLPFQPWQGENLSNKHILVFAEQGVGDEVMFTSCLPDLLARKPLSLTLECDPRLEPLFARSFPGITVRGITRADETDWAAQFPSIDFQLAIGSLPCHFRNTEAEFPKNEAFLTPDATKTEQWRNRYAALGNGPTIGISWRGGAKAFQRSMRSTELSQWRSLLEKNATFVNLQYGDCTKELATLKKKTDIEVHDWVESDPLSDLDDFAAQLAALDLVISIDNSTVHFAAAVGTKVWTLLPHIPEFRWMMERADSPWYPSMHLFRQPTPNNWKGLFSQVDTALEQWLEQMPSC